MQKTGLILGQMVCRASALFAGKQRGSYQNGGLLSHLHFQYAAQPEALFDPETKKLRNPMWYATMCEDAGTVLEQCNIVRALHRLPVWEKLPEK